MAEALFEMEQFADDGISATYRLLGFLLGTVLAGSGLYYYVVDEYKVSNTLLTEDIYVCGESIQAIMNSG